MASLVLCGCNGRHRVSNDQPLLRIIVNVLKARGDGKVAYFDMDGIEYKKITEAGN